MGRSTSVSWVTPQPGAKPIKVRQPPWVPAVVPLAVIGALVLLGMLLLRPSAFTATHGNTTTVPTVTAAAGATVLGTADVQAALAAPAAAWLEGPSAPTYDALAAAASALLAAGRPFAGGDATRVLVQQLATYPGSDERVRSILGQLAVTPAATSTSG